MCLRGVEEKSEEPISGDSTDMLCIFISLAVTVPESMFLSRNKKNNVYPCKPQFYYIKVGFKESKL